MKKVIYLIKGESYFYATYFPKEPFHPSIETLVYDGEHDDIGHIFLSPIDSSLRTFENNEISSVYDRESLSEWVLKPADFSKPGEEFEYVAL